ncbi:MAG TPA: hypothetical protein VFJ72_10405 [Rubrobacteraceae bacterium]|nr:hypothetical protein [Rubrobacteraceae bacterium]
MRVIEREKEHYEVQEVPYGKVYSWRPERILFECDCGETLAWMVPVTVCRCGAKHTGIALKEGPPPDEHTRHPWLAEYEEWRKVKLANDLRHEYYGFLKAEDE